MASSASQGDAATEYWPITIARSDGLSYNFSTSANQGTILALDPNLDQDVAQLERWEVIIAGHLQNQVGPKDDKRQYKLAGFPKGYELRCTPRKDNARDYYLYGHPLSERAVYRTPGEFALHALWLISGSTDARQCSCDLCVKHVASVKRQSEKNQTGIPTQAASGARTATQAPSQQQQQQPGTTQQQQQQQQQQTQYPGITNLTNVFRVGELVWYKHTAWRLGVIFDINPKPGIPAHPAAPDSSYHFTLAPLGHALLGQESIIKDCQSMRPFLTFSVPAASLEELKDRTFDTVDWPALTERYSQDPDPNKRAINRQVLGLEASKMGARAINDAFSTFNLRTQGTSPDGAFHIQSYGGVYLGAEMVLVGDPIRVTTIPQQQLQQQTPIDPALAAIPPDATLVMHVRAIQTFTPTSTTGSPPPNSTLHFHGDLYRTVRTPSHLPPPANTVPATNLGAPFAEELATRDALEKANPTNPPHGTVPAYYWSWVRVGTAAAPVARAEVDVHGRFYVAEKLMGAIDPGRWASWQARGQLEEAPAYLNNRGQSGSGGVGGSGGGAGGYGYGLRRAGRRETLGDAVGAEFRVPAGMVEE